jgi:hypothetical protein
VALRRLIETCVVLAALTLLPASVSLARSYTYGFAGLIGVGGSLDESDAGLGNPAWQLTFTSDIAEKTYLAVRVGGVYWDSAERVSQAFGPALNYATLAGEYRETRASFSGGFVEPGVFLGIGYYWMGGDYWLDEEGLETESFSDHGVGATIGLTGDVALNERRNWTLRIELSGHYADLDAAQLFVIAHIGVAYHF